VQKQTLNFLRETKFQEAWLLSQEDVKQSNLQSVIDRISEISNISFNGDAWKGVMQMADVRTKKLKRNWIMVDFLTPGNTIICAKKGNWKSLIALQQQYALASGTQFLGRAVPNKVKTLYLALELDETAMSERTQRIGPIESGADVIFEWSRGDKAIQDFEAVINAKGYRVIFVDMLSGILPEGIEGNSYEQSTEFMKKLRRLGQKLGVCFVILMHSPKATKDDFADAVLGSVGWAGQADIIAFLSRERGSNRAKIYTTGNHGQDSVMNIEINTDLHISLEEGNPATFLPPEAEAIYKAFIPFGEKGATCAEVAGTIGKKSETVRKCVNDVLIKRGYLVKISYGFYKAVSKISNPEPEYTRNNPEYSGLDSNAKPEQSGVLSRSTPDNSGLLETKGSGSVKDFEDSLSEFEIPDMEFEGWNY